MLVFIIFLLIIIPLTYFHIAVLFNYVRYRNLSKELQSKMEESGITEQDLVGAFNSLFVQKDNIKTEEEKETKQKERNNYNNIMYQ